MKSKILRDHNALTPGEAAKQIGIHYNTLRNWIASRYLKVIVMPSGRHYVPMSEVERLIEELEPRFITITEKTKDGFIMRPGKKNEDRHD